MTPWLSEQEIDDLCMPLKQHAAQARFLKSLGLEVKKKPNGAPLVMRVHLATVVTPAARKRQPEKPQPNRAGLALAFSKQGA